MDSLASLRTIPDQMVRDFDLYNIPGTVNGYCDDVHVAWKQVQDTFPDIFWTPRYGGHWVATRYREVIQLTQDTERFSNAEPFIPRGVIPHTGPSQLDAPEHGPFRKLVGQAFTPAKLKEASFWARTAAVEIIEELRPRGRCNFMEDFAGVMPIVTFLNLLGMPTEEAPYLKDLAGRMTIGQDSYEQAAAEAGLYIDRLIQARRATPRDDFITTLINAEVMGRPMTPTELHNVVLLVVTGGLDTVINTLGFATTYLARNPQCQRDLRENPAHNEGAVNEIVRRFGMTNLARLVRKDCQLGDVELKAGEQVLGIYPLAGLDERVNPDPMAFDPQRKGGQHIDFGSGPHTCLGVMLARREIRVYLDEWIGRMPEFRIAPGTTPRMASGLINSVRDLHIEWEPG